MNIDSFTIAQVLGLIHDQYQSIVSNDGYVHPNLKIDVDLSRKGNELIAGGDIAVKERSIEVPFSLREDFHTTGPIRQIADTLKIPWPEYFRNHAFGDHVYPLAIYFNHDKNAKCCKFDKDGLTLFGTHFMYTRNKHTLEQIGIWAD